MRSNPTLLRKPCTSPKGPVQGPQKIQRKQRELCIELVVFLKETIAHLEQGAIYAAQPTAKNLSILASLRTHISFFDFNFSLGVSRHNVYQHCPAGNSFQGFVSISLSYPWNTSPLESSFQGLNSSVSSTHRTILQRDAVTGLC